MSVEISVGTTNRAKLRAVERVCSTIFGAVTIQGYDVDSGISAQPMTDEESILGAGNRADAALLRHPRAEYGIGLEGNVAETAGQLFLRGWAVVKNRDGTTGIGHSGGIALPHHIAERVRDGKELGPLMQQSLNDKANAVRHDQGTNGILTNGMYTRVDEFTHAVQCALAPFVRPDAYAPDTPKQHDPL